MRIVVTNENLKEILAYFKSIRSGVIAADTETTGLKWHDTLFSLQLIVKGGDSFYFNFLDYKDGTEFLPRSVFASLHDLWNAPNIRWVLANAKYDMRRLDIEGVALNGDIWDILLMDRIRYNRHMSYSLDSCLKRIGLEKDDAVSLYIKDHKLYTTYSVEGKKVKEKDLHYDKVPFELMCKYGFSDVEGTLAVYEDQMSYFELPENREQIDLVHSNMQLVKTVFNMERRGIQLDMDYVRKMYEVERDLAQSKATNIEELTSLKFKNGPKFLAEILRAQGLTLELSKSGNPILDKTALKIIPNAIAHNVVEMRDHEKRAGTYSNLQRFADSNGVIHTNYRLNGTDTFRFSCGDPNLQNVEACSKGDLESVRTAFKPSEGFFFVSIDYKAMEYRLVADIAGEMDWIRAINDGVDPHQWVADLMGVERSHAKTVNFQNLYGGGVAKLALSLFTCMTGEEVLKAICMVHMYKSKRDIEKNMSLISSLKQDVIAHEIEQLQKADKLKKLYFEALPNVAKFTQQVQEVAIQRGYVRNQFGMRYYVDNPRFSYRLPNHLIQGTGACTIRGVMPRIDYLNEGMESSLILQIHDELKMECRYGEEHLISEWKRLMENEYKPINGMRLECDVEFSEHSWNSNTYKHWKF